MIALARWQRRTVIWLVLGLTVLGAATTYALRQRARPQTVVSLTFDDGFLSQLRAQSILRRYGDHATFYINSARLDTARRLTADQVRLLAAEGNEIGGHTLDHVNLPTLERAARVKQICDDRIALVHLLGSDAVSSFAYPYGALTPAVERDVAVCGYNSARTVGGLDARVGRCAGCPDAESASPGHRFRIRSGPSFVASTPIAHATEQILAAERAGGGWVPLVFHEVCDHCSKMAITPANLTALLDWIHARGIPVRTVGEVVGGATRPVVTTATALRHTNQGALASFVAAGRTDLGWRPGLRLTVLAIVALLFTLPVGTLALLRSTGRW